MPPGKYRYEEESHKAAKNYNAPITKKALAQAVRKRWLMSARPKQIEPPGDWFIWLVRSGRGWGKTRVGSEWAVEHCRKLQDRARFHLVGQTFTDVRDVMVEGESGILSILPPSLLKGGSVERSWNRSLGQLTLDNGAFIQGFSAEKPRRLRGPQCTSAWGDEPSTWSDAHLGIAKDTTFDNLQFGTRIGPDPRILLTGTPRPVLLIKQLENDPKYKKRVVVTYGSTYENLDNLAPQFRETVIEQYEGTRLGRQELYGAILDDVEGALWNSFLIEKTRIELTRMLGLQMQFTVVAVDPSVSEEKNADETGMVVVARGPCPPYLALEKPGLADVPHAYVFDDLSGTMTPGEWARKSVQAYHDNMANLIVGEANNGGALVKTNIQNEDENVPVALVHASAGKYARAEPVVMMYEKNRVHHVGIHAGLEDQMTTWVPHESKESPDRIDALVWGVAACLLGATKTHRRGKARDRRLAGRR